MSYVRIEFDSGKKSVDVIVTHADFCSALRQLEHAHGKGVEIVLTKILSNAALVNGEIESLLVKLEASKVTSKGMQIAQKIRKAINDCDVDDPKQMELRVSALRDFPFHMDDEEPGHEFYDFVLDKKVLYSVSQADVPKAISHLEKYGYALAATILRHLPNSQHGLSQTEANALRVAAKATPSTKRVLIGSMLAEGVRMVPHTH